MYGKALLLVVTAALLQSPAANAQSDDRSKWSIKDVRKVIKGAFRYAPSGVVSITEGTHPRLHAIWLTDDVCWAISRIVQHEERRTDTETKEIYDDCRVDAAESYSIYVSAYEDVYSKVPTTRAERQRQRDNGTSEQLIRHSKIEQTSSHPVAVNQRLDQIFLQRRDNRDVFVRPTKIDTPQEYFSYLHGYSAGKNFDIERDVIITFPRSLKLVQGAKDIDIQMRQGKGQLRLKFKLKNLRANKGKLANL